MEYKYSIVCALIVHLKWPGWYFMGSLVEIDQAIFLKALHTDIL